MSWHDHSDRGRRRQSQPRWGGAVLVPDTATEYKWCTCIAQAFRHSRRWPLPKRQTRDWCMVRTPPAAPGDPGAGAAARDLSQPLRRCLAFTGSSAGASCPAGAVGYESRSLRSAHVTRHHIPQPRIAACARLRRWPAGSSIRFLGEAFALRCRLSWASTASKAIGRATRRALVCLRNVPGWHAPPGGTRVAAARACSCGASSRGKVGTVTRRLPHRGRGRRTTHRDGRCAHPHEREADGHEMRSGSTPSLEGAGAGGNGRRRLFDGRWPCRAASLQHARQRAHRRPVQQPRDRAVSRAGDIVWRFGTGSFVAGPHTVVAPNDAQRVPGGLTLIAGTGAPPGAPGYPRGGAVDSRVLLVNRAGKIVWQYGKAGVTGTGPQPAQHAGSGDLAAQPRRPDHRPGQRPRDHGHARPRRSSGSTARPASPAAAPDQLNTPNSAELLSNGHILIADEGGNRVIEVTKAKSIVWSYSAGLNAPAFASRLPDGHTLITDGGNNRVVEVDARQGRSCGPTRPTRSRQQRRPGAVTGGPAAQRRHADRRPVQRPGDPGHPRQEHPLELRRTQPAGQGAPAC